MPQNTKKLLNHEKSINSQEVIRTLNRVKNIFFCFNMTINISLNIRKEQREEVHQYIFLLSLYIGIYYIIFIDCEP